jgi:hypothetical protein
LSYLNNVAVMLRPLHVKTGDPRYPSLPIKYLGDNAPKVVTAIGNFDILQNKTLAVSSSVKCPGNIILKTYDIMKQLREKGITVISGFHSPMECECFNILVKGNRQLSSSLPEA